MIVQTLRAYGIPKPQARPRAFKMGQFIRVHSPKTEWFNIVHMAALEAKPIAAIRGAVYLSVKFWFPRPKSCRIESWNAKRPDADNLLKVVMDALTNAGWWEDDGRVALVTLQKLYETATERPGALVEVVEMAEHQKESPRPMRAPGVVS
jgi:Holliday junction resolvase RusA-like endonuclease